MPRPKNKEELLNAADLQFVRLNELIDSMSAEEQTAEFMFEDRDRNLRDVLVHLYEWHLLLLDWASSNRAGECKNFLPEPYNWKTYPAMNVELRSRHQETSLDEATELLRNSHTAARELADSFTDDELFIKKYFPWTGTTNLGSYFISATSSHYDWAVKKIKSHIKTYRESRG